MSLCTALYLRTYEERERAEGIEGRAGARRQMYCHVKKSGSEHHVLAHVRDCESLSLSVWLPMQLRDHMNLQKPFFSLLRSSVSS